MHLQRRNMATQNGEKKHVGLKEPVACVCSADLGEEALLKGLKICSQPRVHASGKQTSPPRSR